VRATTFSRRDVGIGYLAGEGDDPHITRSYYVDGPAAETVIVRARAMREKAGTLSGHALGQAPDQAAELAAASLLDDVLAVVPATEGKVWSETVVERLAELRPAAYDGWRPEQLSAALKPYGVTTGRQVWGTDPATGKGANCKGVHREDIAAAVEVEAWLLLDRQSLQQQLEAIRAELREVNDRLTAIERRDSAARD